MPDLGPDAGTPALRPAAPTPVSSTVSSNPWYLAKVGLAAAAAGLVAYVGVSAAQLMEMSSPVAPVAVEAPAPYVAPPQQPAPRAAEDPEDLEPEAEAPAPQTAEKAKPARAERKPEVKPAKAQKPAKPSADPSDAPKPAKQAPARAATARSVTDSVATAPTRQERRVVRRKTWADRQIAAMLKDIPTSPISWYSGGTWVSPTTAYHLTATFGESGRHWSSTHTGLDFAARTGTPVRSVYAGTVTAVGWGGAYGNRIEVTHPDGTETWYCHLSQMHVDAGDRIGTGTVIGAVGATGNVTGPHLHLEVRTPDGTPVDPYRALLNHGVRP